MQERIPLGKRSAIYLVYRAPADKLTKSENNKNNL